MKKGFILFAPFILTATAFGQNLTLHFDGTALNNADTVKVVYNGQQEKVLAGELQFSQIDHNFLFTYCSDLGTSLGDGNLKYSVHETNPTGTTGIDLAGRILEANFSVATTAHQQAALQLAIWSALYNGGSTFNSNGHDFKVKDGNQAVLTQASNYYTAGTHFVGSALWYKGEGDGAQGQLGYQAVPLPASIGFLAMGILGLAAKRRQNS